VWQACHHPPIRNVSGSGQKKTGARLLHPKRFDSSFVNITTRIWQFLLNTEDFSQETPGDHFGIQAGFHLAAEKFFHNYQQIKEEKQ
jgi:hypothetical protein